MQVKVLIQDAFEVKVLSVNSYIKPGKFRRLDDSEGLKNCYKRVFVTVLCLVCFYTSYL